jgi:large subunit ribosomal protein L24
MKIRKNDTVKILIGKDSGKTGKVERVFTKKGQVVVAGMNIAKRHIKKGITGNEGTTLDIPKPLNISNVGLVCPNCKKVTRVGYKKDGENKLRICKKCDKEIGVSK